MFGCSRGKSMALAVALSTHTHRKAQTKGAAKTLRPPVRYKSFEPSDALEIREVSVDGSEPSGDETRLRHRRANRSIHDDNPTRHRITSFLVVEPCAIFDRFHALVKLHPACDAPTTRVRFLWPSARRGHIE